MHECKSQDLSSIHSHLQCNADLSYQAPGSNIVGVEADASAIIKLILELNCTQVLSLLLNYNMNL